LLPGTSRRTPIRDGHSLPRLQRVFFQKSSG
jgi:hypothetical protein